MIEISKKLFLDDDQKSINDKIIPYLRLMQQQLTSVSKIYGKSSEYIHITWENNENLILMIQNNAIEIFDIYIDDVKQGFLCVILMYKQFMKDITATMFFINLNAGFFTKDNISEIINKLKSYYKRIQIKHFVVDLPIEYKELININDDGFETNLIREYLLS